jgi:hypothetical protein
MPQGHPTLHCPDRRRQARPQPGLIVLEHRDHDTTKPRPSSLAGDLPAPPPGGMLCYLSPPDGDMFALVRVHLTGVRWEATTG